MQVPASKKVKECGGLTSTATPGLLVVHIAPLSSTANNHVSCSLLTAREDSQGLAVIPLIWKKERMAFGGQPEASATYHKMLLWL